MYAVGSVPRRPARQADILSLMAVHTTSRQTHKHLYNICTTSARRLRRWADIVQMLYKCFVLAGISADDSLPRLINEQIIR